MLKEFEGQMPKIDKKAHAFESADLIGKVEDNQQRTQEPQQIGAVFPDLPPEFLLFGGRKLLLFPEQPEPKGF